MQGGTGLLVAIGCVALLAIPLAGATDDSPEADLEGTTYVTASDSYEMDSAAIEAGFSYDAELDAGPTTGVLDASDDTVWKATSWFGMTLLRQTGPEPAPRHSMLAQMYAVVHPELAQPTTSTVFEAAGPIEDSLRDEAEDAGLGAAESPHATGTAEATTDAVLEPVQADASAASDSDDPLYVEASAQAAGSDVSASSDDVKAAASFSSSHASPAGVAPDEATPPAPAPAAAAQADGDQDAFSQAADVVPAVPPAVAAALAVTAVFGAASATAGFLLFPGWRAALTRALKASPLAFLFSRIAKDDVLDHPRRAEIFEFVKQNPGERVEAVRKALGLANGTMLHHLQVLRDKDLVRKIKQGGLTRLYPAGPKIEPAPYLVAPRRAILETINQKPGLVQRQVGARVDMSERMVSYHVKQLAADGLVEVRRDGSCNRVYPAVAPEKIERLIEARSACPVS